MADFSGGVESNSKVLDRGPEHTEQVVGPNEQRSRGPSTSAPAGGRRACGGTATAAGPSVATRATSVGARFFGSSATPPLEKGFTSEVEPISSRRFATGHVPSEERIVFDPAGSVRSDRGPMVANVSDFVEIAPLRTPPVNPSGAGIICSPPATWRHRTRRGPVRRLSGVRPVVNRGGNRSRSGM